MFKLPDGYEVFGVSNNGNTLTAIKEGSTNSVPLLLILDRSQASFNSSTSSWSVPSYRVRVIRGLVDSEGVPRAERLLVDANFRTPVGSEGQVSDLLSDFVELVNQEQFADDGIIGHRFPTCCSEAPEEG